MSVALLDGSVSLEIRRIMASRGMTSDNLETTVVYN